MIPPLLDPPIDDPRAVSRVLVRQMHLPSNPRPAVLVDLSRLAGLGFGPVEAWERVSDLGVVSEVFRTPAGYLRVRRTGSPHAMDALVRLYSSFPDDPRLPRLLAADLSATPPWCLESALPGVALAHRPGTDIQRVLGQLMGLLCKIHEIPADRVGSAPPAFIDSPVHRASPYTLELHNMVAAYVGADVAEWLGVLHANMPPTSSLVPVHSDATAYNVLICPESGDLSGLVDFEWMHVNSPIHDLLGLVGGATADFHHPSVQHTIDFFVRSCPHLDFTPTVEHLATLLATREAALSCADVLSEKYPPAILDARLGARRQRMSVYREWMDR